MAKFLFRSSHHIKDQSSFVVSMIVSEDTLVFVISPINDQSSFVVPMIVSEDTLVLVISPILSDLAILCRLGL